MLRNRMLECRKCPLRKGCNQVVVSQIPNEVDIMFVGEAPGQDEDLVGEPFVGRCGKLFRNLIKKSGLDLNKIYITNTVKCRPPKNRVPTDDEINICKDWLYEEIKATRPKVIVTLGKTPTKTLVPNMKKTFKMSEESKMTYGAFFGYDITCEIRPWYHPSYMLRHGKKFDDMTIKFLQEIKYEVIRLEKEEYADKR